MRGNFVKMKFYAVMAIENEKGLIFFSPSLMIGDVFYEDSF